MNDSSLGLAETSPAMESANRWRQPVRWCAPHKPMVCSKAPFQAYFSVFQETRGPELGVGYVDSIYERQKQQHRNPFLRSGTGYRVPVLQGAVYRAPPFKFETRDTTSSGQVRSVPSKERPEHRDGSDGREGRVSVGSFGRVTSEAAPRAKLLRQTLRDVLEQFKKTMGYWQKFMEIAERDEWIHALVERSDSGAAQAAEEVLLQAQAWLREGARLADALRPRFVLQTNRQGSDATSAASRRSDGTIPSASSREHQVMSSQMVASHAPRTRQPRVDVQASSSNAAESVSRNPIVPAPVPKELETGRGTTQRNPSPTKPCVRGQTPKEVGRRGLHSEMPAESKQVPAKSGRYSAGAGTVAQQATVLALHPPHDATLDSNNQVENEPHRAASRWRSVVARVPSRGENPFTGHSTRKEQETIHQTSAVPSRSRGCGNGTVTELQKANAETTKRPSPALNSELDAKNPRQRPEESGRNAGSVRTGSVSAPPPDSETAQVPPTASPSLHRSPGILSRRLSRSPVASPETGLPAVVHEDVVSVTAAHDAILNKRCPKRVAAQLLHDQHSSSALNMTKGPTLMPRPSTAGIRRGSTPDASEGRSPQASSLPAPSPATKGTTDTKTTNQTTADASTKETNGYLPRLRRLRERVQKARALAEATWNREDPEAESSI